MSDIATARAILHEVKERLFADGNQQDGMAVSVAIAHMYRRKHRDCRAPASSATITPELRAEIRAYAEANPQVSLTRIAERFQVNSGRVSEALAGDV